MDEYGLNLVDEPKGGHYDAIIAAVAHNEFRQMSGEQLRDLCHDESVIFDLKYIFDKQDVDIRL